MAFREQIEGFQRHIDSINQVFGSDSSIGYNSRPGSTTMESNINTMAQDANIYDESPCLDKAKGKESELGSQLLDDTDK